MEFIHTEEMDDSDDGPPMGSSPEQLHRSENHPRYPETPGHSHRENQQSNNYSTTFLVVCLAIAIAHLGALWTLRTDINALLEYHKESRQQYTHLSTLLQNMQVVQWRMVPADI